MNGCAAHRGDPQTWCSSCRAVEPESIRITQRDLIEALHLTSHAFPTLWAVTDGCGCQERGGVIWSRLAEQGQEQVESLHLLHHDGHHNAAFDPDCGDCVEDAAEDFNVEGQPEFNGAFR